MVVEESNNNNSKDEPPPIHQHSQLPSSTSIIRRDVTKRCISVSSMSETNSSPTKAAAPRVVNKPSTLPLNHPSASSSSPHNKKQQEEKQQQPHQMMLII